MAIGKRKIMSAGELCENVLVLVGLVVFCLLLERVPEFPTDPTGNSHYVQQASARIS